MKISIQPEVPFDLYRGLTDVTREPFGLTERLQGDVYQTIILDRLVTIRQDPKSGQLSIEHEGNGAELQQVIVDAIERRLGLKQDLKSFYEFAAKDPVLALLVTKLKGLTMFQKATPFEALVSAITDQQLTVSFATTLKHRLITRYGSHFRFQDIELWTFPRPERLAELSDDALRPLQYSGSKSRYIVALARGAMDGGYKLDEWSSLNDDDLLKALMSIHGVGRWTAEYAAMVGYNRCNLIPAADIGLMRAVQRCYHLEERPTETQVRRISENWQPWRGLVTYYLWHAYE